MNGRQRAFHFVRQMLDVVFDVGAAIDFVAQLGEGTRQLADFIAPARGRFGRAAGGEQPRVAYQAAHRDGQPGGERATDQQRCAKQEQALACLLYTSRCV